jgi:hypothetical protein
MRYRDHADAIPANTADWIGFGAWVALAAGICLLILGFHGRQQWLKFWGGLTIVFCFLQVTVGLEMILSIWI